MLVQPHTHKGTCWYKCTSAQAQPGEVSRPDDVPLAQKPRGADHLLGVDKHLLAICKHHKAKGLGRVEELDAALSSIAAADSARVDGGATGGRGRVVARPEFCARRKAQDCIGVAYVAEGQVTALVVRVFVHQEEVK